MINSNTMILRPAYRWCAVFFASLWIVGCTGGDSQQGNDSESSSSSVASFSSASSLSSSESSSSAIEVVKTGAVLYRENCAICHQADGKAVGEYDMNVLSWSKEELYSEILLTMPLTNPKACLDECAEKVTKYIREELYREEIAQSQQAVGYRSTRVLNKQALIRVIEDTFSPIKLDMTALNEALPAPLHSDASGFDDNAQAVVGEAFLETLLNVSESVAEQVAASDEVKALCDNITDRQCAVAIITAYAGKAFRKSVPNADRLALIDLFNAGAGRAQKIALLVQGIITSPNTTYFLALGGGDSPRALTPEELAERLSLFLWQAIPDQALNDAKANLADPAVMRAQVERMMRDNKASISIRGFVAQWLEMQDPQPKANFDLNASMANQLSISASYLFDYLLRGPTEAPGTMADLYLSRKAFVKPSVAKIYGEPIAANAIKYRGREMIELSSDERAGILTRAGFVAALSSNEITSPTRIGNAVRERVLCQHIPFPSDPSLADIDAAAGLIGREFVEVHASDALCAGCHAYLDELGLIFESYNPAGKYRTAYDNGTVIDPSGYYASLSTADRDQQRVVEDAVDLSLLLSTSDVAAECLAENMMRYAVGRSIENDKPSLTAVMRQFKDSGYQLSELLHAIVQSRAFTHQGAAN